ncbi:MULTISPECIES: hypothetical protein [Enterobacter]|uniref:hypothetical protein n=1 Tax=Enterobacter TaxID=547 RepID=UPI00129CC65F|nr:MULTISPECIES: hypothetical protein [Enterobacter]MBE3483256.1 hypothetical protein [Enterobacter cloacae complex sp. P14RS]MCM8385760.1 hypothetical protein [Enterobacter hormaechei]MRI47935.1 hypothetical protein [Enterobacter ludwigii]HCM9622709.1 hypothetical protein [Enterobacter hormaechei subsp. hoffmannii]
MQDLEKRVSELETIVEDLLLDQHAARIAITTMSTAWNSLANKPGLLGDTYDTAVKATSPYKFDNPVNDGYAEQLHERVIALLSKSL